ncbi:restriction endonuclease subunit S [Alcaligenes nematophilus]|uniref:restriction endonuclease subunit S n=1 Tax=Pseudomonadota TaxID=1224 RepID=UPI0018C4CD22|nr:restriction endonuclease subunit S [Proteus terrae]MBG2837625.1 restriction endonuclease subunit S [Proteus terrae subsp. cibarius]MBG2867996.1 restriction endonuclease subunit S [Proteus terrae subsp. cibarius]
MSWSEKSLDQLGFVSRGRSRHRPRDAVHLYGGQYPFVQTGDVKHAGLYLTDYSQTYSEEGLAQSKLWPVGTLCITIAANIADTSILAIDACFPDSVIGFIPDPEKADARFVKYLFDAVLKLQYRQFTQGAAQDNLSQAKLLALKFLVPDDVIEQTRIADFIATYDGLIENNHRRIQLLEESARLLYQEWFVHLRFPGHEQVKINDGVPEGWCQSSVGELSSYLNRGITPKYDEDGEFVVINQKCIRNRILSLEPARKQSKEFSDEKEVRLGDILINSTGTGTLGRVAQVWDILEKTCVDTHVTIVRPSDEIPYLWLGYTLLGMEKRLEDMGEGATNQKELKRQYVSAVQLLKPPHSLMKLFHETVLENTKQIQNLIKTNKSLAEARDLLLPKLMSGELTV